MGVRGERLEGRAPERGLDAARKEWNREPGGEREDRSHQYAWGHRPAFERLLAAPPADGEQEAGESTRFGALACRLWTPIRAAEQFS